MGTVLAVVDILAADKVTGQPVSYERRGPAAWLTIDRPEARNALNAAVRDGLWRGVRRFNADDAPVLVLTGAGDQAFCAGGDLKEMAADALEVPPPDFLPLFGRNIDVPKPTIAAVNGVAYAGGFLLAQSATCASPPSTPGSPSPRSGSAGARRGPRRCPGSSRPASPWRSCSPATRSPPSGRTRSAWSTASCPTAELATAVQELAERIAANAPLSVLAAKRTVRLVARAAAGRGVPRRPSGSGSRSTTARTPRRARPRSPRSGHPPGRGGDRCPPTSMGCWRDLADETDGGARPGRRAGPGALARAHARAGLDGRGPGDPPGVLRRDRGLGGHRSGPTSGPRRPARCCWATRSRARSPAATAAMPPADALAGSAAHGPATWPRSAGWTPGAGAVVRTGHQRRPSRSPGGSWRPGRTARTSTTRSAWRARRPRGYDVARLGVEQPPVHFRRTAVRSRSPASGSC